MDHSRSIENNKLKYLVKGYFVEVTLWDIVATLQYNVDTLRDFSGHIVDNTIHRIEFSTMLPAKSRYVSTLYCKVATMSQNSLTKYFLFLTF